MAVRPYQFEGLRKYTRSQLALLDAVSTYISKRPFNPNFRQNLGSVVQHYLKVPCEISDVETQALTVPDLKRLLPNLGCLAVFGLSPSDQKIIVDLDGNLAVFAIERLLGGTGDQGRFIRSFTEIEEGVLSFLVLKLLAEFQEGFASGQEFSLSLDRFAAKVDELDEVTASAGAYVMVGARVAFGKRLGYVRILLPQTLIQSTFGAPLAQSGAVDAGQMRAIFNSLGQAPIELRVEGGHIDLAAADLASLEPGDIIILENPLLTKVDTGIEGDVFVKVGLGKNGGLQGRVTSYDDHCRLQITDIVVQEQPTES